MKPGKEPPQLLATLPYCIVLHRPSQPLADHKTPVFCSFDITATIYWFLKLNT